MAYIYDPKLGYTRPVRNEIEAAQASGQIKNAHSRGKMGYTIGSGVSRIEREAHEKGLKERAGLRGKPTAPAKAGVSERKAHIAKGGSFYGGIPIPIKTEKEKREEAEQKAQRKQQKDLEAAQRRVESAKNNSNAVMNLIEGTLKSGRLQTYIERFGNEELETLLRPFSKQFENGSDTLNNLIQIYNNGSLEETLSNPEDPHIQYRKNWRSFLETVEVKTKPSKRQERTTKNSKITLGSAIGATIKYSVIGLAIVFGGKALLDANNGSLLTQQQCVTSDIGVNIRTEPSSWQRDETVIARLPFNSTVQTLAPKVNEDWYRATATNNGQTITGYVHGDYIGKCTP